MAREDEGVGLHLDNAFARFKQSCADVTRTIQATRPSLSEPLTIPPEPPKDVSASPAAQAHPRAASKRRSRKSRSLLTLAGSAGP
jgi:hypothetical protein